MYIYLNFFIGYKCVIFINLIKILHIIKVNYRVHQGMRLNKKCLIRERLLKINIKIIGNTCKSRHHEKIGIDK